MPGERFSVRLLPEDGGGSGDRVLAEVGLEGFNILDASGSRNLRKYPLHHISRWSMRGSSLILFTRSPVRSGRGREQPRTRAGAARWCRSSRCAAHPPPPARPLICRALWLLLCPTGGCGGSLGDPAGG
jgi:hypothetical protein